MYLYIYICIYKCIYLCIYKYIFVYTQYLLTRAYFIYIHRELSAESGEGLLQLVSKDIFGNMHTYVDIHTYIYIYI
jgi:hypothetical protein